MRPRLLRCVSDLGLDASGRMLTIGKLGASPGQLEYCERQVAAGAEDYYAAVVRHPVCGWAPALRASAWLPDRASSAKASWR